MKKYPGPKERTGLGFMGFKIIIDDKTIVNLGDSLLQKEWEGMKPDVLMIPIGGAGGNIWTMDVTDAIEAVKLISPKMVIPCHYNVSFFWIKNINPAFDVLGSKPKISYIPEWMRVSVLKLLKMFTGSKTYGPVEFFMTVMAIDMVAPEYGKYTLKEYFASLKNKDACNHGSFS